MAKEKRLIDANALKEKLNDLEAQGGHKYYRQGMNDALHDLVPIVIDDQPTVDAVEVVHGRWVDGMVRDWRCSECGKKVPRQVHFDGYCYDDKLNYCPNCGAKMDGGNEDA